MQCVMKKIPHYSQYMHHQYHINFSANISGGESPCMYNAVNISNRPN